jgi:hypothetical protein
MNKNILIESIVKNISRNIINEAKSDKLVKQIHRFLVNQFKKRESAVEDFLFTRDGEDIEVSVYFAIEEIEDFNHPFSIDAGSEWDEIDVTIEYRPDAFPKHMNELSSELKETVEHEVEHLLQTFFEDKYIPHEDSDSNLEYLISGREVPAYVKGLVARSRHKKISLDDAMEEWFRENILKFDNPKEDWKIVKSKWMDYANSAREKNQIKKFK